MAFHGRPRFTGDIDFFIRVTRENADRVLQALDAFGFGSLGITASDLTNPERIVQLGNSPNRIDFDTAWASRAPADLDGHPVNFIGADDLLKNKHFVATWVVVRPDA